jgi:hypothetical protein
MQRFLRLLRVRWARYSAGRRSKVARPAATSVAASTAERNSTTVLSYDSFR